MTVSPIYTQAPTQGLDETQQIVFDTLAELHIPFERVEHDWANTMEDCKAVSAVLGVDVCKNLVLCNRQKTQFTLLIMPGAKPFRTKDLSAQLGCSRLSFADAEHMQQYLCVTPGSVSVLGLLNDTEKHVRLVIDRDVLGPDWFGCHPCRNTSSLRIATADLTGKILPALRHEPTYVSL